uniref:THAP domain containing 3 n=1 Tax=Sus scrofa TaxID=9823 RepID=A0A4X1W8I7_PIG
MPKSCAARQCCNRYSSRRKQLTFHRFPFSRPELLKEWVLNIGRGDFEPKQHTVICSEHFRPECFSAFGNRKNLKHNAVPTEFTFQGPPQLVRETADPDGQIGAASEKGEVHPETGPSECGPGRKRDTALEVRQPPPDAGGPRAQVRRQLMSGPEGLCAVRRAWGGGGGAPLPRLGPRFSHLCPQGQPGRTGAVAKAPGQPASPPGAGRPPSTQPPDHSYALLDLDALKKKLFLTLRENERLRRRLRAQRLVMRRMASHLQACRAGSRPEQQS